MFSFLSLIADIVTFVRVDKVLLESLKFNAEIKRGKAFDGTTSTQIVVDSTNKESKDDILVDGVVYKDILDIDYKVEKYFNQKCTAGYLSFEFRVRKILPMDVNNQFWFVADKYIHIWDKDVSKYENSIKIPINETRSIVSLNENYLVVSSACSGLHIMDKQWKLVQTICEGKFTDVYLVNRKLHAYEHSQCQVKIICQTSVNWSIENTIKLQHDNVPTSEYDCFHMTEQSIYVSMYKGNCIHKYSQSGELLKSYGKAGKAVWSPSDPGFLNGPILSGVDRNGDMLVVDTENCRLQVCSDSGRWSVLNTRNNKMKQKNARKFTAAVVLENHTNIVVIQEPYDCQVPLTHLCPVVLPQLL